MSLTNAAKYLHGIDRLSLLTHTPAAESGTLESRMPNTHRSVIAVIPALFHSCDKESIPETT
jgi:hypothetical protein